MREVPYPTSTYDTLTERRSPLPLDSPFIQQTKDRIREIVAQITQASQTAIEPLDFWAFVLPRVLDAMGGEGAAIWVWRPTRGWQVVHRTRLPAHLFEGHASQADSDSDIAYDSFEQLEGLESQISQALQSEDCPEDNSNLCPSEAHGRLLDEVRKERQPVLIPPRSASVKKGQPSNPTEHLLILVPLPLTLDGGELWLELIQMPSGGPSSQRGYLRFAAQMAELLADYLKNFRLRTLERDQEFMRRSYETMELASSTSDIHRGLSNVIGTIRNTADAEHAILFRRNSSRHAWRVIAIAGLPRVDRRADGIHLLEDAAPFLDRQLRTTPVLERDYTASSNNNDLETEVKESAELEKWKRTFAVSRLIWWKPFLLKMDDASGTSTLLDSILTPTETSFAESTVPKAHDTAILLTWSRNAMPPVRCVEQGSLTLKLGLSILRPSWWQHSLIRESSSVLSRSPVTFSRKWVAFAILAMVAASVLLFPVPLQIESTAILRPSKGLEVFASADGTVAEVLVKHGQSVRMGEPLVRIESPTLMADHEQSIANHVRSKQRLIDLDGRLLRDRSLTASERDTIEGERDALIKITQLEENGISLLQRQIERLTVRALTDGIVETWRVEDNLQDRPVRMGQWLLSIREKDSPWELQAVVPERHLHELRNPSSNATTAIARMTSQPKQKIRLRASEPTSWRPIETNLSNSSSRSLHRDYRVSFAVEDPLPTSLAITGASARVAIATGRGPLLWALSKDFIEDIGVRTAMWLQ